MNYSLNTKSHLSYHPLTRERIVSTIRIMQVTKRARKSIGYHWKYFLIHLDKVWGLEI